MKHGISIVLVAVCLVLATGASADFVAYTRVQGSAASANVTELDLGESGLLKDFSSGLETSVTAEVYDGGASNNGDFFMPNSGTEAYTTFNGKFANLDCVGYGNSAGWYCDLVFTGLDTSKTYEFVSLLNRGTYDDRWTVISIVDADASTYASTSTAYKISETEVSMVALQTTSGEVARWTGIKSGADGDFTIHYTHASAGAGIDIPIGATQNAQKAYGPAGFMLVEIPEPATMSLLAISGIALIRRRRRA
jgi:hypothetical protein